MLTHLHARVATTVFSFVEMAEEKAPEAKGALNAAIDERFDNAEFQGTKSAAEDMLDMQRMGKKQQLIVRLSTVSSNRQLAKHKRRDTLDSFLRCHSWPWLQQRGRLGYF